MENRKIEILYVALPLPLIFLQRVGKFYTAPGFFYLSAKQCLTVFFSVRNSAAVGNLYTLPKANV